MEIREAVDRLLGECALRKVENPAQHQFCTSGYISATGVPLLACTYTNADLIDHGGLRDDGGAHVDSLRNYELLHLGRNHLAEDVRWVRIPPNGRITTPSGQDLRGVNNLDLQAINSDSAYFSRTNMCEYMTSCYNHDGGLNYQDCQEYWNTSAECTVEKAFLQGINPGYWLFLYIIVALIVLVLAIGIIFLLNGMEMDAWKAAYYQTHCGRLPAPPPCSKPKPG